MALAAIFAASSIFQRASDFKSVTATDKAALCCISVSGIRPLLKFIGSGRSRSLLIPLSASLSALTKCVSGARKERSTSMARRKTFTR
ncbi:hypothetical protein D3C87_1810570 [compost metagenome]